MRTSSRNSLVAGALLLLTAAAARATPIDTIDFSLQGSNGQMTAGISTTSAASPFTYVFAIDCFIHGNQSPDVSGEVIHLDLLEGGQVVPGGMTPSTFTIVGGRSGYSTPNFPISFTFFHAGTVAMRIRPSVISTATLDTPTFTVSPNAAAKLVSFVPPDQNFQPGRDPNAGFTGVTGVPAPQQPGQPFTVRVRKTDNWFNLVATAGPSVTLTSGNLVTLPPAQALVGGAADFPVSIAIARSVRTITASDGAGGLADAAVDVPTSGPEKEQVFPFPSPFNPHEGSPMTFRFQLNEDADVTLVVKDRFGQDVWRQESLGLKGPNDVLWDGRNNKGVIVAAGVYDLLLELGGDVKSKKRFGVVK